MADYMKLTEVARKLDISERTARRYVKSGELSSVLLGGIYRVSDDDLERFVESRRSEGPKVAARAHFPELPGLTAARKRRGISRNELAARSGLVPSYVAELEGGAREATPDILERLADALNASPPELGAPAAQYAAFLEKAKRDAERDNERVRQELDELSPGEMRALAKRALLEWPALRKIHDALEEGPERQSTEEAG